MMDSADRLSFPPPGGVTCPGRTVATRLSLAVPVALTMLLVLLTAVFAQNSLAFPPLSGRVVDAAGILPQAARDQLDQKLKAHEDKTSDQLVVATIPSLQDTSVEDYANLLFRHWKLGQAKTNNGVLVLVAPNERKIRVEVGYGLEGTLTDALARTIIQAAIAPKFKQGDYAGGLVAGVDAIIATLQGDSEWQDRVKQRNAPADDGYDPFVIILIVIMIIVIINIMSARQQMGGRAGGRAHRRSDGGWIVIPSSGSWGGGSSGGFGGGFGGGGGGFSGGGGSSGGGGASGDW
jgi:uncharacterized protein